MTGASARAPRVTGTSGPAEPAVLDAESGSTRSVVDAWWFAAAIAILAAVPTLLTIAAGPDFMADDFVFADTASTSGLSGFLAGIDVRSRPLQAGYHGITFVVFRENAVAHLLALAALNAAVAVVFLRVLREHFHAAPAALAALWFVVLPNHGSTRLWISTGPIVISQLLLLGAALAATRRPSRLWLVLVLVAAAALAYEGGLAIGLTIALVAAWSAADRNDRIRRVAASALSLLVLAAWIYRTSPKNEGPANRWFASADAVLPSLFGSALLPSDLIAASPLIIMAILIAAAAALLPAWRRPDSSRLLAAGAILTGLGIAPFVITGFPLSTDGMLDRANSFAVFGVALLLAGTCEQLLRLPLPVAVIGTGLAMIVVGSANARDVSGALDAQRDGQDVLAALEVSDLPDGTRLVLGPTPNREGYAPFGYGSIHAAWYLRSGQRLDLTDTISMAEFEQATGTKLRFEDGMIVVVTP